MKLKKIKKLIFVLILSLSSSCALMFNEDALVWDLVTGDSLKSITSFKVLGKEANISENKISYTFKCDFDQDLSSVSPIIEHNAYNIYPKANEVVDLLGSLNYLLVAADGSSKKYEVAIKIAEKSSKELINFKLDGCKANIEDNKIIINVDDDDDIQSMPIYFEITGSKLDITFNSEGPGLENGDTISNLTNGTRLYVFDCQGYYKTYEINILRPGSTGITAGQYSGGNDDEPPVANPSFIVDTERLDFNNFIGIEECKTIKITNDGDEKISNFNFENEYTEFYINELDSCNNLNPENSCNVEVCIESINRVPNSDTLLISSGSITRSVSLLSTNSYPIEINDEQFNFGNLTMGTNHERTIIINNLSNTNINLTSITPTNNLTLNSSHSNQSLNPGINSIRISISPTNTDDQNVQITFSFQINSTSLSVMKNINVNVINPQYSIYQTGPGGGVIFYDKGNYSNGWRYFEADSPIGTSLNWQSSNVSISDVTSIDIGTGKSNTDNIIDWVNAGGGRTAQAAEWCRGRTTGGQTDWFLPSKDELILLMQSVSSITQCYWSSSQYDQNQAYYVCQGNQQGSFAYKQQTKPVRCVRSF